MRMMSVLMAAVASFGFRTHAPFAVPTICLALVFLVWPRAARVFFGGVHAVVLYAFHFFTLAMLTQIYFLLITPLGLLRGRRAGGGRIPSPAITSFERPF